MSGRIVSSVTPYAVADIAALAGVSVSTTKTWIARGLIPKDWQPKKWRWFSCLEAAQIKVFSDLLREGYRARSAARLVWCSR